MPALAKAFTECIMKRCRYLKLFAYIMCLCNGLVVAVLGYASLTRLNVLSVESQRWGLYEHQRHLAALAVATIVLGSACALAAVLGCVDALLARRPHLALDVVAGVLILAQVGVASAGFTLMIWVKNDIPPGRTNCKGCLKNVIFVCSRLIPAIGSLLLASTVAQCIAIIVNRVDQSQAEVQAKLDRANNLEEYRMKTVDQFIGSWAPRKSQSWGGNLDYSGSMFSGPVAARQAETAAATTPRTKLRFGAVRSPPERIRPPIKIVITEAQSDASTRATAGAAFQRDTQGEGGTLSLPDFSHYANVE
ncbi:uncharacterized protein LOC119383750 [Rhipicephalus sanguineus]|uniref:uncharacterized protein LOC119383750 n=1 Tax=Rhipicephalus sanguineus TaxID=34632 RepID=UPI001895081D|nr:uncharacterized protein LOC119383750 [Rhipicephalus sanguineus]